MATTTVPASLTRSRHRALRIVVLIVIVLLLLLLGGLVWGYLMARSALPQWIDRFRYTVCQSR